MNPFDIDSKRQHTPTPEAARALVNRIGKPVAWIAARTGISDRRLRYILDGYRTMAGGKRIEVTMKYPEQHTLECLAWAMENARAMLQA